jgi:hypothetical protein
MTPDRMNFVLELSALLCTPLMVSTICGTIVVLSALRKSEPRDARMLDVFFRQGTLLQLITAFAVILAALLLRMLDLITSEASVSILSATSGYVLGGITKRSSDVRS